MKKLILFLSILLFANICFAKDVVISITDNNPAGSVLGYTAYYYDNADIEAVYNITSTDKSIIITDDHFIPEHTYSFYVTAYGYGGESEPSNIVEYSMPVYEPPEDKPAPVVINIPNVPVTININQGN